MPHSSRRRNRAIVLVNEAAERMFGYPPGALLGLPIETLVPEHHRERHREHGTRSRRRTSA